MNKQRWKYRYTCALQVCHKINPLEYTIICAHNDEYAHEYVHRNNSWNISRSDVVNDAHMLVIACTENME